MAITTYVAKKKKRSENWKKDQAATISSTEDEREGRRTMQDKDRGFEEEEREPSQPEEQVRKRLYQRFGNKVSVP